MRALPCPIPEGPAVHLMADSVPEMCWVAAPDGEAEYFNRAAASFAGGEGPQVGWNWLDLLHPDDLRRTGAALTAAVESGERFEIEYRLHGADGHYHWVVARALPLVDSYERVTRWIGTWTEIAERRPSPASIDRDWIQRIKCALEEDRFVLYAQPIFPICADRPVQDELLIRMLEEDGSIVAPGSFLPPAESSGLIAEIDRWVIRRAARIVAERGPCAVNLSAASIGEVGLLATIERDLAEAGADPGDLTFELTETAVMDDVAAGTRFARGLEAIGCGLALDDFGTGFGSFTYLKMLPINRIKIDIGFVRDLTTSSANRHLIKAIVGLASDFGYETVAEGVEDAETLDLLKTLEVDFAQGYHLGRPAAV